nr:PREDICTED: sodium channel protein Nach-like [Linepithema humile]
MIPFPAITLCPLIPPLAATRKKLLQKLRLPHNMDNETAMFLLRYGPAFTNEHVPGGKAHINNLKALLKINHMSMVDFLKLLRPCEDLFDYCSWENISRNCSDLFKISYTFEGVCCSFNYHLEESVQSGRTWNDSEFLRTTSFGGRSGLQAVLHRDLLVVGDEAGKYIKYSTNSAGLVVAIIPTINHKLANYYVKDSYGAKISQCVDKDINLKYFPTYQYTNCFISCSIDSAFKTCNCVPYYYTPMAKNYSLRICEWEDFQCLYTNKEKIRIIHNTATCECRYPCKNVAYATQATSIKLNGEHNFNVSPFYQNRTDAQAVLRVFMNYEVCAEMDTVPIADELYLLAAIGGIFSLFVGCSFISAMEIFYFIGLFLHSYSNSNKKSK